MLRMSEQNPLNRFRLVLSVALEAPSMLSACCMRSGKETSKDCLHMQNEKKRSQERKQFGMLFRLAGCDAPAEEKDLPRKGRALNRDCFSS